MPTSGCNMIKLKLHGISQVYYWRYFEITQILQLFKNNVKAEIKLLKMPSSKAWVDRSRILHLKGAECKGLEVEWEWPI